MAAASRPEVTTLLPAVGGTTANAGEDPGSGQGGDAVADLRPNPDPADILLAGRTDSNALQTFPCGLSGLRNQIL